MNKRPGFGNFRRIIFLDSKFPCGFLDWHVAAAAVADIPKPGSNNRRWIRFNIAPQFVLTPSSIRRERDSRAVPKRNNLGSGIHQRSTPSKRKPVSCVTERVRFGHRYSVVLCWLLTQLNHVDALRNALRAGGFLTSLETWVQKGMGWWKPTLAVRASGETNQMHAHNKSMIRLLYRDCSVMTGSKEKDGGRYSKTEYE